ncbi:MAG: cyanophycinase [Planctomycetota bacterium]|nr:cyanophycinase [Planctomycetota bacterium]
MSRLFLFPRRVTEPLSPSRKAVRYAAIVGLAVLVGLGGRSLAWRTIAFRGVEPITTVRAGGSLLLCGGGKTPEEVRSRFLDLAGGTRSRIVVIPTASAAADFPSADRRFLAPWRDRGAGTVTLLHTRSRDRSGHPDFLKPLTEATGVWIDGGSQSVLAETYGQTEVERQLKALLARGGVIGGTSAGAAIMTRVMIQNGRTEATVGRGFDLLPDAVVDQHFLRRKRMDRLVDLMAKNPGLLGFGIDEQTALLVQGNRLSVLGSSYVVAVLPALKDRPSRIEFLHRGDETDLASLRSPSPQIIETLDLDAVLASDD